MKYRHFIIAASLTTILLSACEKKTEQPDPEPLQPVTADITYTVSGGADMAVIFDVAVSFTSETGGMDSTVITNLPFEKKFSKVQIPFTASMTVTYIPKANIPEKDFYQVGFGGGISYKTSYGKQKTSSSVSMLTIGKDNIQRYIAEKQGTKVYSESIN